jgi:hypothetical protein
MSRGQKPDPGQQEGQAPEREPGTSPLQRGATCLARQFAPSQQEAPAPEFSPPRCRVRPFWGTLAGAILPPLKGHMGHTGLIRAIWAVWDHKIS